MVKEPHCCFNNQPFFKSTLNNVRIPNTAEFLAIFVTTGQLTGLPNQREINIIFLWSVRGWHTSVSISYHMIASADLDSEALAPECNRPLYPVRPGDTCNAIAERYHAPTLVSL